MCDKHFLFKISCLIWYLLDLRWRIPLTVTQYGIIGSSSYIKPTHCYVVKLVIKKVHKNIFGRPMTNSTSYV